MVDAEEGWLWRLYGELETERPIGFGGLGPIPDSRIDEKLDREGIELEHERRAAKEWLRAIEAGMAEGERDPEEESERQQQEKDVAQEVAANLRREAGGE